MNKKATFSLILGVAVSAAALYFAFRNVPLDDLIGYMGGIDYAWVGLSMLLVVVSFLIRAYRWRLILSGTNPVRFAEAYHPMMIGFAINCILPGRVGEIARPIILRRKTGVPFTTGLATLAVERAFDILLLMGLLAAVIAVVDIDPGLEIPFGRYRLNREMLLTIARGMLNLGIVLVAGIFMVGFDRSRALINRVIVAGPSVLFFVSAAVKDAVGRRICIPLTRLVDNLGAGFSLVRGLGPMLFCTLLSMAVWTTAALSYYAMSRGCPGIGLTFWEITAMMVIICFFIALPSVPGFWGLWEAGGMFALYILGVDAKAAAGFTLANHALQILPVVGLGIASAVATGVNVLQISRQAPPLNENSKPHRGAVS